ncbi:A24 family peptidase C-terminal domain-containing protein [Halostagnicola sp. A-GB9-2]|uniref:A24 family peptidase C-terminal domain-containing protein n=1 Tax=Halostagnicola sp. A-GB9-2 TaxID=3048066 RepID=UPI0024BF6DCF|nr:A24 family peptidase C-terminal domain-containing protein [Halostagnicola sp. A-GB9-2]MDJ1432852.1 A24 family peptidase C-terminal domain-containing protein [Halostagnicola sp. A-GB9-2]
MGSASLTAVPDLLRLIAVPVFAWVAYRDIKTRRVSSGVWIPLSTLGALLLVWDGWLAWNASDSTVWFEEFLLPVTVSLGFVVPLAYLFWWFGGFGGADAKALMALALLFPTFPQYVVGSVGFPTATTPVGTFSFTILTNAVLIGIAIPLALAARNALAGRIAPVMFLGWPISWDRATETHGTLLESPSVLNRGGLDLDALRMYLRWRNVSLEELRSDPERYRDPDSLPEEPNQPTDGAVDAAVRTDGGEPLESSVADEETERAGLDEESGEADLDEESDQSTIDGTSVAAPETEPTIDDPWGAEAFLEDIDHAAYGTSAESLRSGLESLTDERTVWISPGTPFLVPVFLGLVIALVYGDLLFGLFV